MNNKYILEGKKPVVCDDLIKWGQWFEKSDRKVAFDKIGKVLYNNYYLGDKVRLEENEDRRAEQGCLSGYYYYKE